MMFSVANLFLYLQGANIYPYNKIMQVYILKFKGEQLSFFRELRIIFVK